MDWCSRMSDRLNSPVPGSPASARSGGVASVRSIEVEPLIDAAPIGSFQLRVLGICACIALMEGFDNQAVSYVAQLVMSAWKPPAPRFSIVFVASLIGAVAGAVGFGFMGDRFGRRRSILTAMLIVAVSTLVAASAHSLT